MNILSFWDMIDLALFGVLICLTVLAFSRFFKSATATEQSWDINSFSEAFGFLYDKEQDIFYSAMNAWQREFGYCRLYDEAMAPLSMIADAEPIRFSYGGKFWLIEFWKGQYGMTTGTEVGVYTTAGPELGELTFYGDTLEEDHLDIRFVLQKNGHPVLHRQGVHWWLTGFRLGEFSAPEELTLSLHITARDEQMRDAFVAALHASGYFPESLTLEENTVSLTFAAPRTPQPATRTRFAVWLAQRRNKRLCDLFQKLTGHLPDMESKLSFLNEHHPGAYRKVVRSIAPTKRYAGPAGKGGRSRVS